MSLRHPDISIHPTFRATTCAHPTPDNKRSLELDYSHWAEFQPTLSIWVADAPRQMLEYMDEAATEVRCNSNRRKESERNILMGARWGAGQLAFALRPILRQCLVQKAI